MKHSDTTHCPRCGAVLARDNGTGRCGACQIAARTHLAAPPALPPGFWEHEPIQLALTNQHLGQVIRAYRNHPYHGRQVLPQTTVASWLGITQAQLSRIEGGKPVVHLDRLCHWARVLGIPRNYLWFRIPGRSDGGNGARVPAASRRSVLTIGSAAVAAALVPGRPEIPMLSSSATELGRILLTAGVDSAGEPATLDELTTRAVDVWRLRQLARYEALSAALPPLLVTAQITATQLKGEVHDQATRVLVHSYNAASSLLKRLGDTPLALVAANRAVQSAQAIGDPMLVAASLYRTSNVLLTANRLEETQSVALKAATLVDPARVHTSRSLATWGGLLLTAAVAAARRGLRSETWELMGEARTAARLLHTDHADIYSIFGPTNVAIHGVQVAVELGDGRDAVRRSAQVDCEALPDSLIERRGQYLLDLARGYALAGEDHEAKATLLQAESIAPQEFRHNPDACILITELLQRDQAGNPTRLRDLAARVGTGSRESQ